MTSKYMPSKYGDHDWEMQVCQGPAPQNSNEGSSLFWEFQTILQTLVDDESYFSSTSETTSHDSCCVSYTNKRKCTCKYVYDFNSRQMCESCCPYFSTQIDCKQGWIPFQPLVRTIVNCFQVLEIEDLDDGLLYEWDETIEWERPTYKSSLDSKRRNVKERRKRVRKKYAYRIVPHAMPVDLDDESHSDIRSVSPLTEDTEPSIDTSLDVLTGERNRFVHAAVKATNFDPVPDQGFWDMLDSMRPTMALTDGDEEDWFSYVENIAIMGYYITKATTFTDIFMAIVTYIKMNTSRSLIREVFHIIDGVFSHDDDLEPHALSVRDITDKWELLRSNPIFKKVSYLITAAMSLTVCNIKKIEWSPLGLELISLHALEKQQKATDILDAAVSTFTWIADTGYRVFKERSLIPLFYTDNHMRDFNDRCDFVSAHYQQVLAGNSSILLEDFEFKVDNLLQEISKMKSMRSTGPTSYWLQNKYELLVDVKYKIVGRHRNTQIRFAPFGMGLTGPSGVGKSTLAKIVMNTSLNAMGIDPDPKRIITKDLFDKYDSTYTSDILGVYMDDVGNGKSQFTETSPTDVIIKYFNNVAAQAVKAELNEKGVVFVSFKVGVLTSNFEDYNVRDYSNKPEASLRRFYHTRVRVKKEFVLGGEGGLSLNQDHPKLLDSKNDMCTDVWELDIEECHLHQSALGKETYRFQILKVDIGSKVVECKNLSLADYLDVVIFLAQRHKRRQELVVQRANEFDAMTFCKQCCRPLPLCACLKPHSLENIVDMVVTAGTRAARNYFLGWINPIYAYDRLVGYAPIKKLSTRALAHEFGCILEDTCTPVIITFTPKWIFKSFIFQSALKKWRYTTALYDLRWHSRWGGCFMVIVFSLLIFFGFSWSTTLYALLVMWFSTCFSWLHSVKRRRLVQDTYFERRDALPDYCKEIRDSYVTTGVAILCAIGVCLKSYQVWQRAQMKPNALLDAEELEKSPGWFGSFFQRVGVKVDTSISSQRAHPSHLLKTLQKSNLFWCRVERPDGTRTQCNIFFPRKCVAWIPHHVFFPQSNMNLEPATHVDVHVVRNDKPGGRFKFRIDYDYTVKPDNLDLICVYVPNCPDLRDKTKWLPETLPTGTAIASIVYRREEEVLTEKFSVTMGDVAHAYRKFYGGRYIAESAKLGTCMGPIVLEQKDPCILGFHIGGNAERNIGVMQTITRQQAEDMYDALEQIPGICLSAQASEIPETQYGRSLLSSNVVHHASMASRLTADAYVECLGSTMLRSTQTSAVEPSVLSEAVAKHCGVQNEWGPPALKPNWKAYNTTLEQIADPSGMFSPLNLERARQDWIQPLRDKMREYVKKEDFRPLNMRESILGIPGKRFIDALPMDTGMGFPMFGPKKRHFEEIRDGEILVDRIPDPCILEEYQRLYDCWDKGERGYPVTSATLKDEPTPIGKEKVRVFQAVAVALGLHIRKYFLPIARFLSLHPVLSESAVGVNCMSGEWQELMDHALKFADNDKVLAWDYSKYDIRMNSQMTRAVFYSMIELAEVGGYDKNSLRIMRMMISDIVHPLIDYNGTMLMAYNMNTSGNNVTVNVNSIAGSLYVRLGFFHVYPNEQNFRAHVAAMTYGDDFIGSVNESHRAFNFLTFRKFLSDYGMKITLPDKSDNEVELLDVDKADFLKRQSNYIQEIGTSLGRLAESSIFKALHSNLRSKKVLPETVAVQCIETAMHEWFAFGREHYNLRASQMQAVCKEVNLPVPAVLITFDERVEDWLNKYKKPS